MSDLPPIDPDIALEMGLTPDDIPEVPKADAPPTGETREAWCEAGHTWQAPKKKGRTPKFCPEHKPTTAGTFRAATKSQSSQIRQLEDRLTQLLSMPALPMAMVGDAWPAEHVAKKAPPLAHQIVEAAKERPALLSRLLSLLEASGPAELLIAAGMYLIPLLIYYGVIPGGPILRSQFNIPDRQEVQQQNAMNMQAYMQAMMREQEKMETEQRVNGVSQDQESIPYDS